MEDNGQTDEKKIAGNNQNEKKDNGTKAETNNSEEKKGINANDNPQCEKPFSCIPRLKEPYKDISYDKNKEG